MTTEFVILSAQKPPHGAPCNGCGMCCQEEACGLSLDLLKSSAAPCVALEWSGGSYRCGLVVRPAHYLGAPDYDEVNDYLGALIANRLGVGRGCDSDTRPVGRA